jgi:hypothetical protein
MNTLNDILNELIELNSQLATVQSAQVYSVPEEYFDLLPSIMMARVKALEARDVKEETGIISTFVGGLDRGMPYEVPGSYFQTLPGIAVTLNKNMEEDSVHEIETLSPLLNSLKNKETYSVPAGYFEQLSPVSEKAYGARVIPFTHRSWFRIAAAAVVAGALLISGLFVYNRGQQARTPIAVVGKEIRKMNDTQKAELMDLMDAGLTGNETVKAPVEVKSKEIRSMLQDIPREQLEELEAQTEDIQDVLMTN